MYEIIQRIIDIDKAARELTHEAVERRAGSSRAAEAKKTEVTEQYLAMARKRVDVIRSTEIAEARAQLDEGERCRAQAAEKMKAVYDEKHGEWVAAIVARVTSGDDLL